MTMAWRMLLVIFTTSAAQLGASGDEKTNLFTNQYHVPPSFFSPSHFDHTPLADPFAEPSKKGKTIVRKTVRETLEEAGVEFGPGAAVIGSGATSTLIVRNTPEQLSRIDKYIEAIRKQSATNIQCRIDIFQIPSDQVLPFLQNYDTDGDQSGALDEVTDWISKGKARHQAGILCSSRSGSRVRSVSGKEVRFLSEYSIQNGKWQPQWETRQTGTIVEFDATIGSEHDLIEFEISIEHHYRQPEIRKATQMKGEPSGQTFDIDLPQFHFGQLSTQIAIASGNTRIIGALEDSENTKDHTYLIFLSSRISKAHLYKKTYDQRSTLKK